MTALIYSKYGKLSPNRTYDYLKRISKDLGIQGDDIYNGEGMPILPDRTVILIKPNENFMLVDGLTVKLDQPAIIDPKTNRTLVPLRAIAEALGCSVSYDNYKSYHNKWVRT